MIIDFDFDKALRQADTLDGVADEMRGKAANTASTAIEGMKANWQGNAATKFQTVCEKQQKKLDKQAQNLQKAAERIRKGAQIAKQAEEEAIRIIEARSHQA